MKKKRKYAKNRKNVKPVDSARLSKFSMSCVVTVVIVISALCVTEKRSEFAHVNAGNMRSFKEVMNDTSVEPNSNAAVNPCPVPNPFVKRPLDAVVGARKNVSFHIGQPDSIAMLNLMCARGLPGAENLDIDKCLNILEAWTRHIDTETKRYLSSFSENPKRFYNSLAYYKVLIMMTILKEDMGIRYNPDWIRPNQTYEEFLKNYTNDSRDAFIHGLLTGKKQGTCASMPVLVVAIGEILEYPLRLVACKGHLFVRWDDGVEVFNFDVSGGGVQLQTDEYYRKWPWPLTEKELDKGFFMKSLSRTEIQAAFLITRAAIIKSNGDIRGADQVAFSARKVASNAPVWENRTWVELNRSAMAMGLAKSNDPEIERKIDQQRAIWESRLLGLTGAERQNALRNMNMQLNVLRDSMETLEHP